VRIGEPAHEPVELLERLHARLEYAGVRRAYRAMVQRGEAAPELIVGIQLDGTHSAAVVLGELRSAIDPGQSVSFILIEPERPDTVADWMITHSEPFFTSSSGRGE
jgi:hypothetical protein